MLPLLDPTGCCVMKRKDGECPDPEVKLYHRGVYRQYLGKPVDQINYVWWDNESIINSPIVPEAKLYKEYSILSFHYVRIMISRGYINLQHLASNLASKWNFSDILTKHWSYQSSYHKLIHPVFQPNETWEVDASIAKGTIFGILGSE